MPYTNAKNSVVEINIGILCACIPVAFVLIKRLYHSAGSSLTYIRHRLISDRSTTTVAPAGVTEEGNLPGRGLPSSIPRGVITGLQSFIRDVHGEKLSDEESSSDFSKGSCVDLQSIDYERFGRH